MAEIIDEIVKDIFTDGDGKEATRLILEYDGATNNSGRNQLSVAGIIKKHLESNSGRVFSCASPASSGVQAAGQWVSVNDKKPSLGEKVLVKLNDDWVILIGRLNSNGWSAFYSDGECLVGGPEVSSQVTHWMLLPKP